MHLSLHWGGGVLLRQAHCRRELGSLWGDPGRLFALWEGAVRLSAKVSAYPFSSAVAFLGYACGPK